MKKLVILYIVLALLLVGCGPSDEEIQAIVQTSIAQIQAVIPTATLHPNSTSTLTPTPRPSPTSTPSVIPFRSITWMELQDFLSKDHTNWNAYSDKYVCVNFALDLAANAKKENLNAWIVLVTFEDFPAGHAFVAFETSDKGVVWIEPQSDYAYRVVEVGDHLCSPASDRDFCDWGATTEIIQPAYCGAVSQMCVWVK